MLSINKTIHEAYENLDKVCRQSFSPFGIEDNYHTWYYAGKQLFIIRDVMMDSFVFVRARNLEEAYEKYTDRWLCATNAGALMDEDEIF